MNDRPPPSIQLIPWPPGPTRQPARSAEPIRIGDAERDRAVSSLGDHFAAGRLTREELDTRIDDAMAARFDQDLRPLFVDLPRPEPVPTPAYAQAPAGRSAWPMLLMAWLPLLMVGAVVTAIVLNAPWLLWGLFWLILLSAMTGRGRYRRPGPHYYRR